MPHPGQREGADPPLVVEIRILAGGISFIVEPADDVRVPYRAILHPHSANSGDLKIVVSLAEVGLCTLLG